MSNQPSAPDPHQYDQPYQQQGVDPQFSQAPHTQQPYEQQQYGQPYPQQPMYQPVGYGRPEHPQSQTVFILGIVGIFTGICSYIAWYMGGQAKKEIEAGAPYPWGGNLKTGYTLGKVFGIIYIVLLGGYIAIMLLVLIIALAAARTSNP